jgi:hypothetical protein
LSDTDAAVAVYAGYIRASQALYPRGGMWVFAAWYATMAAVLIWATAAGAWGLRAFYLVALTLAAIGIIAVQRANGARLLQADEHGIRFGRQPRACDLSWSDVARLRVSPAGRAVRLDVILSPAAVVTYRPASRQAADLAFMFFVPGAGVRRNIPAIVVPRRDPARYELPLLKVTAAGLRDQLAVFAPGIPVEVAA